MNRRLLRMSALVMLAVLLALVAGKRVAAAGTPGPIEVIAGWEGDTYQEGYGFVTLGGLMPAGAKWVVPLRVSGSRLDYRYDSTTTSVRVGSYGVSATAGIRRLLDHGSLTVLGGAEVRWEHRAYEGGALPSRDQTIYGAVAQFEGDLALARRVRTFLLASYAGAANYGYGRAALRWQANNPAWEKPNTFFLGAEGVLQGNDESAGFQAGPLAEWVVGPANLSFALHSGYKESWSPGQAHRRGPYFGAGLYHRF